MPDAAQTLARRLDAAADLDMAGDYGQAADALDALIDAARADGGPAAVLVAAMTRRAALAGYAGRLDVARALLVEAVTIAEAGPPLEAVLASDLELELGRLQLEESGPDEADVHLDHAADLAASIEPGPARSLALARALVAQGASRRLRGDYRTAETRFEEAVGHAERAAASDTDRRRAVMELVHALDELGVLYKFSGEFDRSLATYERAMGLLMEAGGADHPDMATFEHNLGGLAHARGDGATAEMHARRSVELHERTLGPDHLATVLDRSALAAVLDQQGATAEAERLLRECAEQLEHTLGPHHRELAVVLNNLAAISQRAGRLDDAHDLFLRSVAIKERALGPESPSVAIALNNLATVQRRQGKLDQAAKHYARALDIMLASAGPDHPHVAVLRRNMSRVEAARRDELSGS